MKHSKKLTFLPVRRFEENLSTGLSTLFFLGVLVDLLALFSQSDIINGGIFTAEQNTTADYISASSELLVGFSLAGIAFLLGHITCRVGKRSFRWRKVSWLSSILGSTLACCVVKLDCSTLLMKTPTFSLSLMVPVHCSG